MQDTISSVFLAGRDRCARLRQIGAIVICGALFLHLTLFLGYTRTVYDADAAKRELVSSAAAAEATADVHESLAEFAVTLAPAAKPILDRLLDHLRADFAELGEGVDEIRGVKRPPPPGGEPRMEVQQGPPIAARPSALRARLADKAAQDRIRAVRTHEEFRAALDPLISETIVAKRFAEANEEWATHVRTVVRPAAAAVRDAIGRAAPGLQASDARWRQLAAAVTATESAAAKLRFKPPAEGDWWKTSAGKIDAIQALAQQAADALVGATSAALLSDDLAKTAQAASRDAQTLSAELEARREEIEDQAKNAIASLTSFAKPLEMVAVDVKSLVRWFPLVVGIALAIGVFLGTEAVRARRDAADFVAAAAPADEAWTRVVAQERAALAPRRASRLAWLGASAAWTALAAWRLASLGMATPSHAATVALGGCAVVGVALLHRAASERTPAGA